MKINFGTGLMIFFTLWALALILLAVKSSKENIDLVSDDYYNREIAYQGQIDKQVRSETLSSPVIVSLLHNPGNIVVQFPIECRDERLSGSLHFYKPDNAADDFDVAIAVTDSARQYISYSAFKKGLWRIQIDWRCGENTYYSEEAVQIN